ncbi:hypothetical protein DFH06DRAFT_759466 [Mycena polygramma]|nr:hypothetical protein DFH06DRAFT_759466 [Mycena polygramma]
MLGRAAPALRPSFRVHLQLPFSRSSSLLGPAKTTSQSACHSRELAVTGIGLRTSARFFSDEAPAVDTKPAKKVRPLIYAVCKNCRRKGHMFWDCPEPVVCVACGDHGHRRSQCPHPDRQRLKAMRLAPKKCFRCLETGHVLKDCKAPDKCHECGQEVHIHIYALSSSYCITI